MRALCVMEARIFDHGFVVEEKQWQDMLAGMLFIVQVCVMEARIFDHGFVVEAKQ